MTAVARQFDQFYTRRDVARDCVADLLAQRDCRDWLWVEPAAGDGAFLDGFPARHVAMDIDSRRPSIARRDFLGWRPEGISARIAVVGNPPFGKNASLARAFVNHAASFADLVAFILPRTFEKPSFVNRIDRHLHLIHQRDLPLDAFEFDGAPYAVPTVFQIWERRHGLRPLTATACEHPDFSFVDPGSAHFAFQRVGARAGLVSFEGLLKSPQSHYFIRARDDRHALFDRLGGIDWSVVKHRTAGNPSIGKGELVAAYSAAYG